MITEGMPQFTPPQETPKAIMPEVEITPEQKEILKSAIIFAEYLTGRWPQVDTDVELSELSEGVETISRMNYYLSGSLASMLLSCAEKFTEMDETRIPALRDVRTREIPESARKILASFARQIGDLDYVPTDHYKAKKIHVQNSFGKVSAEEYSRLRTQYIWKGGSGPSFDEVPEKGRKILKRGDDQFKVMCDPVEAYGPRRVVKVNIEGKDYYIARPDTILAYKVLHLLQSYEQKPEKFNDDFRKLLGALKEMYSDEELEQITQQVLTDYEDAMEVSHIRRNEGKENPPAYERKVPKFIERVLSNPQLSPEIKTILERLKK
ncbi:MAG: hypothetical protein ACD_18C00125G0001 [uncultured bacterium]|nr:MAG: hypothetical protein ACD_18C00125G0001 [uncultured bacterium]OGH83560.1 MAG: hypothetical protein A2488_00345 [Candidatus Magasanikbacteria bacterium RIFOXYC12_FULL_32_21b]OGH90224.1 MAG: hypothetical protein A2507_00215 [Candidatus Magasanikbacteria bacterium RIFOXYD12_FULL_33_17]HAO51944.1 hypothetical protein [Candidatus Magasanikbacteria bacterium]